MPEERPTDQDFRRRERFPGLERVQELDLAPALARFDSLLSHRDGFTDPTRARSAMTRPGKSGLIEIHRTLFHPRPGAGSLRQSSVKAVFEGQDCPEPEFVDRALHNFETWLQADGFLEIHPIEQAALSLTRLIDIWPFDFGNRRAGVVFSNFFLVQAGYPPFSVPQEQEEAFSEALSAAIRMQTEPLVGAIYRTILSELDRADG